MPCIRLSSEMFAPRFVSFVEIYNDSVKIFHAVCPACDLPLLRRNYIEHKGESIYLCNCGASGQEADWSERKIVLVVAKE